MTNYQNNNNSNDYNFQQYIYTTNNYINTLNNSISYLNRSTELLNQMYNNVDHYFYYNQNNNQNSFVPVNNNRRRRINNDEPQVDQEPEYGVEPHANSEQEIEQQEQQEEQQEGDEEEQQEEEPQEQEEQEEQREVELNIRNQRNERYRRLSNFNLAETISRNIIKMKYREIENPSETMCPITQEDFEPEDDVAVIQRCGHIFKYESLVTWLTRHQTCPSCRFNILSTSNLIRYTDTFTNEQLFLTNSQFRRHFVRRLFENFIDPSNNSSNVLSIALR